MENVMVVNNEILVCNEPEYENCHSIEAKVSYFVICKKNQSKIGSIYAFETKIAGEKIVSWVARACEDAKVLEIYENLNEIEAVLPYLDDSEYTVVLNGNIPLISKQHLKNILQYIMRKQINVCRLKAGFIFRTDYLRDTCEILAVDTYNLKSNDFFEVTNVETYEIAKKEINKRIINYHSKNGVFFAGLEPQIDANVQIENGTEICEKSMILDGTKILCDSQIGRNCLISKSLIKSDTKIGDNVIIKNSIIGANVNVEDGAVIENCNVGDGVEILAGTKIFDSEIGSGVKINKLCDIVGSKFGNNSSVGTLSKLYRATIDEDYQVFDGKVIIHRAEDK